MHKHTTFIIICENTKTKAHENKKHEKTKAKVQEYENKKLIHFAMGKQVNMKLIYAKLENKNQLLGPFGAFCYFLMPSLSLQPMSWTNMGFYCCVCLMLWRIVICVQLHKLH